MTARTLTSVSSTACWRRRTSASAGPSTGGTSSALPRRRASRWTASARRPTVTAMRRDAESVRDLLLQASGQLSLRMYGPSAHPELPAPLMESRYAWDPDPLPEDRNRRSVYVLARRNLMVPLFSTFDVPDRTNSCPTRPTP